MNQAFYKVRHFHATFNVALSYEPKQLEPEFVNRRCDWLAEEVTELANAENIVDQADAFIDIIYFAIGGLVEMGLRPEELFNVVHNANMAKLWDDGKPRFREDGKIIKPPGWKAPDLTDAINAQILDGK